MGGGEGLNQGPDEILQSSYAHWEAATSLNASRLLCSQSSSLFLPRAILAVALLAQSSGYPKTNRASRCQCTSMAGGRLLCHPMGADLVSNTSTGSLVLHFSPFEGPRLREGRAETLNRFVLICFMILLGAVFTQIRQASGLDNLLEISGV